VKLQVMSDLHLERYAEDDGWKLVRSLPVLAEVLVLAGDITPLDDRAVAAKRLGWLCSRWKHVVYVPGNHEYYGCTPWMAEAALDALEGELPNLRLLKVGRTWAEPSLPRFVGCTLWFRARAPSRYLADFRLIRDFTPWVYEENDRAKAWLAETVGPGDVVVTHHMPSSRSVHQRYLVSPLNDYFLSSEMKTIAERKPALWLHGHSHEAVDYRLHETRILSNPKGYPLESKATTFNPALVVEV